MQILLLSMPDSFEHTPTIAIRMPNGALASLAGNIDPHHRVSIADLVLAQSSVRRTIEQAQIPAGDGILKLTVSIGLATFPTYGDSGQAVLRAADVALYKAKAAGRNRVVLSSPEDEEIEAPAAPVAAAG